jgi:hypothetical protein
MASGIFNCCANEGATISVSSGTVIKIGFIALLPTVTDYSELGWSRGSFARIFPPGESRCNRNCLAAGGLTMRTIFLVALCFFATPVHAEISEREKLLTMWSIIQVYQTNCGDAFIDDHQKEKYTRDMLSVYGQETIADAYLQTDNNCKKFGADKFCSAMKSPVELFLGK